MKILKKLTPLTLVLSIVLSTFTPVLAVVDEYQHITESTTGNTEVFYTQESSFGVTIPKKITLDETKTSTYEVTITGDIASDEKINVIPDESFLMKDQATTGTIKNDVTATVTQDKIIWIFNEFSIIGNGLVSAPDLTAGNWAGTFYFNINLSKGRNRIPDIEVTATDKDGNNLNATASNITGEEKDALLAKLKETSIIKETDEIAALIDVDSDNFDGIANTIFNVSEIAETGDKVVILHFVESLQEWEYIGTETVKADGTVTGDFTSYSPVLFIKVNSDNTYGPVTSVINMTNVNKDNIFYSKVDTSLHNKFINYLRGWGSGTNSGYIGYDFEKPTKINKVSFDSYVSDGYTSTITLKLYGSNDNKDYVLLGEYSWSGKGNKTVEITNTNKDIAYQYYRLNVNHSNTWTSVAYLTFYLNEN